MDIAKYMTTALLLSSVFTDMDEPWVWFVVLFTAFVVLLLGLNLISKNTFEEKSNNKKRRDKYGRSCCIIVCTIDSYRWYYLF